MSADQCRSERSVDGEMLRCSQLAGHWHPNRKTLKNTHSWVRDYGPGFYQCEQWTEDDCDAREAGW